MSVISNSIAESKKLENSTLEMISRFSSEDKIETRTRFLPLEYSPAKPSIKIGFSLSDLQEANNETVKATKTPTSKVLYVGLEIILVSK